MLTSMGLTPPGEGLPGRHKGNWEMARTLQMTSAETLISHQTGDQGGKPDLEISETMETWLADGDLKTRDTWANTETLL